MSEPVKLNCPRCGAKNYEQWQASHEEWRQCYSCGAGFVESQLAWLRSSHRQAMDALVKISAVQKTRHLDWQDCFSQCKSIAVAALSFARGGSLLRNGHAGFATKPSLSSGDKTFRRRERGE